MATAVLAVQGAFAEHAQRLRALDEPVVELRQAADLEQPFERLVLPGGESTVQAKLLREQGMLEPLRHCIEEGMPVLATCAGLILLAADLAEVDDGDPAAAARGPARSDRFATLPVRVRRNAYGRQLGSFRAEARFGGRSIPATFIRAPRIERLGPGVEPLAEAGGETVAVRCGNQLACAFHPELDASNAIHELFLGLYA